MRRREILALAHRRPHHHGPLRAVAASVAAGRTDAVSDDYWIRDIGPWDIAAALMRWTTGLEWAPWPPVLVIVLSAAAAGWALWRCDAGQRFSRCRPSRRGWAPSPSRRSRVETLFSAVPLLFPVALLIGLGAAPGAVSRFAAEDVFAVTLGSLIGLGLRGRSAAADGPTLRRDAARMLAAPSVPRTSSVRARHGTSTSCATTCCARARPRSL